MADVKFFSNLADGTNQQQRQPQQQRAPGQECICDDVKIPVLFANMRSVNPYNRGLDDKFARFKELLENEKPYIVAIVETWLKESDKDDDVKRCLGLQEFDIERQDRKAGHHPNNAYGHKGEDNRRGGGVLLAWRCPPGMGFCVNRDVSEDYADNVVNFDIHVTFNCSKCNLFKNDKKSKRFAFTVVYRPPRVNSDIAIELRDRLAHLPAWFTYDNGDDSFSGWCMVGDFNQDPENVTWENMYDESAEVVQNSRDRTHRSGNTLDFVVASGGLVSDKVDVSNRLISDHYALSFKLVVGKDYRDRRCYPCSEEN